MIWHSLYLLLLRELLAAVPRCDVNAPCVSFDLPNMFYIFAGHIGKHGECKFVLMSESGKFNWKRIGGHYLTSYHSWYERGAATYFIPEVFQNPLIEIGFGAMLEPKYNLYQSDIQLQGILLSHI